MNLITAGPPNPAPAPPPGLDELAAQLVSWLKWGVLTAGMIGLLLILVGRRQRSGLAHEGLVGSVWVLGGLALASVAALIVGAFAG